MLGECLLRSGCCDKQGIYIISFNQPHELGIIDLTNSLLELSIIIIPHIILKAEKNKITFPRTYIL